MVRPCMDMGKLEWAKTERRVQNTLEALKSPDQQWGLKKKTQRLGRVTATLGKRNRHQRVRSGERMLRGVSVPS